MKKKLFLALPVLSMCCSAILAQGSINEQTDIRDYSDELGYYQKANRDQSDPRFMFHDDSRGIDFGIGGTAQMESFYNFKGGLTSYGFMPSHIYIPTEPSKCFGTDISGSGIYMKSRASWNGHKVIGFVKLGGGSDYNVSISQVYVSIDGFSFGMIPTFFTDLEAGVRMYQALNTQSGVTQPLMGYTYRGGKGLEYAVAFEKAAFDARTLDVTDIGFDYQKFPDVTAHVKYRWDGGHVQLGAVVRHLSYWQKDAATVYNDQGQTGNERGIGLSFSGNLKPADNLLFSWSLLGGQGCARYIPFFDGLNLEMGLSDEMDGTYKIMKPVKAGCASLSAMYKWTDNLSSSVIGGYAKCYKTDGVTNLDPTKDMTFVAANLLCDVSDFVYWGVEYFHGTRSLYENAAPSLASSTSDLRHGHANRVAVIIGYIF